jgi:cytochrome c oxidase subunit 1
MAEVREPALLISASTGRARSTAAVILSLILADDPNFGINVVDELINSLDLPDDHFGESGSASYRCHGIPLVPLELRDPCSVSRWKKYAMATAPLDFGERENYLNAGYGIKSWLLTRDHKRIALLYLMSITFFFFIGGIFALLIRLELLTPSGDLVQADTYNKLFTMHGQVMVFFFLIPAVPAVLGNFLIPIMIGAKDLAFPRINLLSWYFYIGGGVLMIYTILAGGVDTGWTFYAPLSTEFLKTNVVTAILGIFLAGFSSILTGLNFIVTVHRMRAPGITWNRLPLFVWAHYATSIIQVLGTPVVAITLVLVALERVFHLGIFNPALGGDPLSFQHLFWFYSHPAVYIMILPGMGIISEVVCCFARKRIFGYKAMALALLGIAVIGFLVWAHHMFVAGISLYAALIFSLLSYFVAVPSAIKVFNWTATMYKGSITYQTPMLYAFGFIGLFTIGGLTGLFLAALGVDVHVHDTYFIIAHFHYIMVGGMVMAYLGGMHFWRPKISGRMYPEGWGKLAALIVFVGFNLTFFPQFILGYMGMPRRYHAYPPEFQILNVLSTAGASILAVGYLLPMIYFTWSMRYGKPAPANPWNAAGLEWTIPSPPSTFNFDEPPVVIWEAYNYDEIDKRGQKVPVAH